MNKLLLGRVSKGAGTYADGELLYITEHQWDCGWYWAFGYIGNRNNHFHLDSLLKQTKLASELFSDTKITNSQWWIIRDLFIQAYALKAAAQTYKYGGHQTSLAGVTDILKNDEKVTVLNADLKLILDTAWDYLLKCNI